MAIVYGGYYRSSEPFGGDAISFTETNTAPDENTVGYQCTAGDGLFHEIWQISYLFSGGTEPEATVNMWVKNSYLDGWSKMTTWTFKYAGGIADTDSQVLQIPPVVGSHIYFEVSALTAGTTLKVVVQGMSPA